MLLGTSTFGVKRSTNWRRFRGNARCALPAEDVEENNREGIIERTLTKDKVIQQGRCAHGLEDC